MNYNFFRYVWRIKSKWSMASIRSVQQHVGTKCTKKIWTAGLHAVKNCNYNMNNIMRCSLIKMLHKMLCRSWTTELPTKIFCWISASYNNKKITSWTLSECSLAVKNTAFRKHKKFPASSIMTNNNNKNDHCITKPGLKSTYCT